MSAQNDVLLQQLDASVWTVTINRPHRRNACNRGTWAEVGRLFRQLGTDPAVRAAILTGQGGHFSAGDDIRDFALVRGSPQQEAEYAQVIREAYAAIRDAPFPVIASISGTCIGGGCGLAMACDFRVADTSARFGIPAVRLGLSYPPAQIRRLASLIGLPAARRWLLRGSVLDAEQCLALGFIDEVVTSNPAGKAMEWAAEVCQGAPKALHATKLQLNALQDDRLDEEADWLRALLKEVEESDDVREGAEAFRERRAPRFTGR